MVYTFVEMCTNPGQCYTVFFFCHKVSVFFCFFFFDCEWLYYCLCLVLCIHI